MIVSLNKASLAELNTILGTEDVYDLFEIILVDNHNARISTKRQD